MELSSTLIGFQPDRTLCFPINFTELSLMGFQVYRNLYIQDMFQENIRVPTSVSMISRFGGKKKGNHITMQCCDQRRTFYRQLPGAHLQIVSRIKPIIPRWMRHGNMRNVMIGFCFLIATIIFNTHLVKVPYSKRAHFFLSSALIAESVIGELYFKVMEWQYEGQILPPNHPTTVRVESILKKIIIGLNNGLNLENEERMTFSGRVPSATEEFHESPRGEKGAKNEIISSSTYEETFNKLNLMYSRAHLERRNWELMVVDTYDFHALYIHGTGRIVFSTYLMEYYCNSEADIAYILGHEIGHGLSLHTRRESGKLLEVIACIMARLVGYHFVPYALAAYISRMWLSRRMESVADYVGLMLMASAGYDPRAAPALERRLDYKQDDFFRSSDEAFKGRRFKYYMKKMREVMREVVDFFIASHPPQERRAKSAEEVMEEAVAIYEQVTGGHEEERSIALF